MSKAKAYFVAGIIVILAGGFLYSLWEHEIWSYFVAIQVFGWYGLLQAGLHMAGWLMKDEPEREKTCFDWARGGEQEPVMNRSGACEDEKAASERALRSGGYKRAKRKKPLVTLILP